MPPPFNPYRPVYRRSPGPQPFGRSSGVGFSMASAKAGWSRVERGLEAGEKAAAIVTAATPFIGGFMPHDHPEVTAAASTTTAAAPKAAEVITHAIVEETENSHHGGSMFSALDLKTLPTEKKQIYLVEFVGGKERAFIAEIVIKCKDDILSLQ